MKNKTFGSERRAVLSEIRRLQMNLQGTADLADLDIEGAAPKASLRRAQPRGESRLFWIEPVKDETAFLCKRP
jgi:hypothetical protein